MKGEQGRGDEEKEKKRLYQECSGDSVEPLSHPAAMGVMGLRESKRARDLTSSLISTADPKVYSVRPSFSSIATLES